MSLLFRRAAPGLAAAALLLAVQPLSAHRAPENAFVPVAADTVRGVVFDSLTREPLAGAFITADGTGASTTADSLGRFTLGSATRITRLTAFHELLDEAGFGALTAARPAGAEPWHEAVIATPSLTTIWQTVCGRDVPASDLRGILVGSTRLPDDRTRVAGALIRVQYQIILPRTGLPQIEDLEARTDSTGSYIVCGVPLQSDAAMMGVSTEVQSAPLRVALDGYPLRRVDLVLGAVDGPVARWPTITGRVVGEDGAPLAGARVEIDGRDSAVTTGPDGTFSLTEVPPGSRMLTAQAGGHVTQGMQVDVLYENTQRVTVTMSRPFTIAGLEGIAITERSVIRRVRREFEERREAGIARFVDSTEIRAAGSLRAALAEVPGLIIERAIGEADSTRFEIMGRGRNLGVQACRAVVFVDGIPAKITDIWDVKEAEIVAVEIYQSESFAPPIFAEFVEDDCAVVVVWTRFGLRP